MGLKASHKLQKVLHRQGTQRQATLTAGKLERGFAIRSLGLVQATKSVIHAATDRVRQQDGFGTAPSLGRALAEARLPDGSADTRTTLFRLEALARHYAPLVHRKDLPAVGEVKRLEDALGEFGLRSDLLELGQTVGEDKLGADVLRRLQKGERKALKELEPLASSWAYGDTLKNFGNAVSRATTKKDDLGFLRTSIRNEVDRVIKKSEGWDKGKNWEWKSSRELYDKVLEGLVHESKRNVRWFLIELPGLGGALQLNPKWEEGDNRFMRPPEASGPSITVPKAVMTEFSQYVTKINGLKTSIENIWHIAETMRQSDKSLGDLASLRKAAVALGERPVEELLREARTAMVTFRQSNALQRYRAALG